MKLYISLYKNVIKEKGRGCGGSDCGGYGHSMCNWDDEEFELKVNDISFDPLDSYCNESIVSIDFEDIFEKLKDYFEDKEEYSAFLLSKLKQ